LHYCVTPHCNGESDNAESLGEELAARLRALGADRILGE